MVPIVEPEVLEDGPHPLERSLEVTEATLERVFTPELEQAADALPNERQG